MSDPDRSLVPAVAVHAARLSFGGAPLFDGLDFILPAGRWTCLLGPSGVGKSTLLRLILGLEAGVDVPDNGNGARTVTCSDGAPIAGRAALMAQTDLLFPWLDVLGNALVGARLRDEPVVPQRERARRLLDQVGLGDRAASLPHTLSGGMRQRAALARTLMENRPIVLMDEPFSAVDAITRLKLQELAARLLAGRTVLLVTHDPLEALRLGHRVLVLAGRPAQLLGEALEPPGNPPRPVNDPAVLALQGDLLRRLEEAAT